jgi:hypothetical protein
MRILSPAFAFSAVLFTGLSASPLFAQQQPAATTTQSSLVPAQHAANPQREARKIEALTWRV